VQEAKPFGDPLIPLKLEEQDQRAEDDVPDGPERNFGGEVEAACDEREDAGRDNEGT